MRGGKLLVRHPGEGRGPASGVQSWILAFAGMTALMGMQFRPSIALDFDCTTAAIAGLGDYRLEWKRMAYQGR